MIHQFGFERSTVDTITNSRRLIPLMCLPSSAMLQCSRQKTPVHRNLNNSFHFYCLGVPFVVFIFQWWPFFSALLSWQNISGGRILRCSGMRGISFRTRLRCHGYGPLDPSSRLWPGNGRESGFLHGATWRQVLKKIYTCDGESARRLEIPFVFSFLLSL